MAPIKESGESKMSEANTTLAIQMASTNSKNIQPLPGIDCCLLGIGQVEIITGRKRSSIYEMIRAGMFPSGYRSGSRSTVWKSTEIMEWINNLKPVCSQEVA